MDIVSEGGKDTCRLRSFLREVPDVVVGAICRNGKSRRGGKGLAGVFLFLVSFARLVLGWCGRGELRTWG